MIMVLRGGDLGLLKFTQEEQEAHAILILLAPDKRRTDSHAMEDAVVCSHDDRPVAFFTLLSELGVAFPHHNKEVVP